ncbi:MAG: hypothetical protein ACRCW2_05470 [Cellulosilyticaceae bacterium]
MENIILSMLLIKNMTVYEMKVFIGKGLTTVCSDSLGSIQSAIKKLLDKGCIVVDEHRENNLIKKEYAITQKGVDQFGGWIEIPMNLEKIRNMEDGKFFFLGMAPNEVRVQSIKGYIESMKKEKEKLYAIARRCEQTKEEAVSTHTTRIARDEALANHLLQASKGQTLHQVVENIYDYQIYSLEYGLKRLEADLCFYEGVLQREMKKQGLEEKRC